jgi:hypothetical protein
MALHRRVAGRAASGFILCLLVAVAGCATAREGPPALPSTSSAAPVAPVTLDAPPVLVVEAVITDKKGAPAQDVRAMDFEIAVDGRRRPGLAIGRLYRGPGAEFAARNRSVGAPGEVLPMSEPNRAVFVVVDQASLGRGDEPAARGAAEAFISGLGLSDLVAVVSLPAPRGTTAVTFDRADGRKALAAIRAYRPTAAQAMSLDAADGVLGSIDAVAPAGSEGTVGNPEENSGRVPGSREGGARDAPADESSLSPAVLRAHARSTLLGLNGLLKSLVGTPGGKTVILICAGLVANDAVPELNGAIDTAARARARVVVLQLPTLASFGDAGTRDLQRLARETGGRVVTLGGKPQQAIDRVIAELSQSYLLLLAPVPGDASPGPHKLAVTLRRRPDLSVQAPALVVPGRVTREMLVSALSPRAVTAPPPRAQPAPPPTSGTTGPRFAHDRAVDLVLARASQYAADYSVALSSVVSEETYKQEVKGVVSSSPERAAMAGVDMADADARTRTLLSDFLLVQVPGTEGWVPFRDVYDVDGRRVRDREDRLVKLFLTASSPEAVLERAKEVWRESARYNIGPVFRTLNVPTLPLAFVEDGNVGRFAFRKAGDEKVLDRTVWVLEFIETARPTFIRGLKGNDVPVAGRLWVNPINGEICRTSITALASTITVNYARRPEILSLLVPVSMEERYPTGRGEIVATATYSNYRQFRVVTTELVNVPKK